MNTADEKLYYENGIDLQKLKTKSVFISYGHDEYAPYARRLTMDLRRYVENVWFDETDIRAAHAWDEEIENGIKNCNTMIALMTKHAYRRPSGVCLNEVVYASSNGKEIIPVMVEKTSVPLLLCNVQYVDVVGIYDPECNQFHEEKYYDTLRRLLISIESFDHDRKGHISTLKKFLKPIDNHLEIAEKTKDFVGREWLLAKFFDWINDENTGCVYYLMGGPGTGKSSFSARAVMTCEEIKGIHFCKYNDAHSAKIKTVIKTLAYHLATQIKEYNDYLECMDMEKIIQAEDAELFYMLLAQPLSTIETNEKCVLVIDGLDEMNTESLHTFLELLERYHTGFPRWFRLLLTSRNNPVILGKLQKIRPYVIDAGCNENKNDIKKYLMLKLEGVMPLTDTQIDRIIAKSEGVFQYAVFLVQEILSNHYTNFEELTLPQGLSATYAYNFARRFKSREDFSRIVPVLEILCAAKEPLPKNTVRQMTKDAYAISNLLSLIGDYVTVREGALVFFHKSICDWLTDDTENMDYYVDTQSGDCAIAGYAYEYSELWDSDEYLYRYGFGHMYSAGKFSEIYELLNYGEDAYYDSFCLFIEQLIHDEGKISKRFLVGMKKNLDEPDTVVCKILNTLNQKGDTQEYSEQIIYAFSDIYDWLPDYVSMHQALIGGETEKALAIALPLVDKAESKDVRLGIYDCIGDAYRLLGDHKNAIENYQKVINGYPERLRAEKCFVSLYNYYDLRYVNGFLKEADEAISRLGKNLPERSFKNYKMWRLKGNINLQAGRRQESVRCFEKCLEIAEFDYRQLYIAESHYSIAEAMVGTRNEDAWLHLNQAVETAGRIHSKTAISRSYFAKVELLVNEQRWEEAVREGHIGAELVRATGYLTGVARIYQSMAYAYLALGEYEKAIEHAAFAHNRYKVRSSYPASRIYSYLILLEAYDKLGRLREAIALDDIDAIPNLVEFDNLTEQIQKIKKFMEEGNVSQ